MRRYEFVSSTTKTLWMGCERIAGAAGAAGVAIGIGGFALPAMADGDCVTPSLIFALGGVRTNSIEAVGDFAYIVGDGGWFAIYDVSDPASPFWVSSYSTGPSYSGFTVVGLAIQDNVVYLPAFGASNVLHIVDVSDPTSAQLLGLFDTGSSDFITGIGIQGTVAFVSVGESGMIFLDVSDPSSPTVLGQFDTAGFARGVTGVGTVMYAAVGLSGLQIVDTGSSPAIGLIDTPGEALDVVVADGVAYVADGESGLQIIDVHDTNAPFLLSSIDLPGRTVEVAVDGGTVYVSVTGFGLYIVDVQAPSSPTIIGSSEYGDRDVSVVGNRAYVMSGETAQILDVTNTCNMGCPADLNGDGTLDFFDVSAFLGAFAAGDPAADFTGDGAFNFFDVSAFLEAFGAGCP